MSATPGEPCWIELFTQDTDAAAAFYGELFGWTAGEASEEFGGYRMFFRDDQPIAGLMVNDGSSGAPDSWNVYLTTEDIARTVEKAERAGGRVVVEPMQVADLGSMAMIVDPAGAAVGAWQPGTFPGFMTRAEVGAPAWFETLSKDYAASVAFYAAVFGWQPHTMSDTDEFRYTTLGKDEEARAGIMDATGFLGEQPSRWQFYVQVEDADTTVEKALAAGATVVQAADDTPYGRLAVLTDPAGVRFNLMGPGSRG